VELKDRLQQISALIADLRQSAADGRKSRKLVDSLFRAVHSFKAAASAEGRPDSSSAAHQFENLLHALRTGQIVLDNDVLQACEESAAGLLDGTEISSFASFKTFEIDKTTNKLVLPAEFALRADAQHRVAEALREGANLFVMKAVFEIFDFDERFRLLKERLEEVAEIISTSATMEDNNIIFQVVYASNSEKIPVQTVLQNAVSAGTSVATTMGKEVSFVVRADQFLLEQPWADVLADALVHLVRNAVDHGIQSHGTVVIEAGANEITVTDDGKGIAPQDLALIFQPGFSTATDVTEFSGRGVGLDAVKTAVEQLGGSVSVTSEPGRGSSFKITMPNPS
jgi:two-component system chemotaxis sensor kinase CheA